LGAAESCISKCEVPHKGKGTRRKRKPGYRESHPKVGGGNGYVADIVVLSCPLLKFSHLRETWSRATVLAKVTR
jgi:hypothetical protein